MTIEFFFSFLLFTCQSVPAATAVVSAATTVIFARHSRGSSAFHLGRVETRGGGGRPLVRSEETESSSTRIADARESVWRCTPTHGGEGWPRPQHYWSFTLAGWMIFFGAMCSEGQLPRHSRVAYEALTDDNLDANEARLQASTCLQTSSRLCKSMI